MSRDIPIIFSEAMILALLAGRKTMTRRLATWKRTVRGIPIGTRTEPSPWASVRAGDRFWVKENFWRYGRWVPSKIGGKVSHSFEPLPWAGQDALSIPGQPKNLAYAAGADETHWAIRGKFPDAKPAWHLRPNIFLERQHSRITLVITETKIERLQDISDSGAIAEGIVEDDGSEPNIFYLPGAWKINGERSRIGQHPSPRLVFRDLINSLHGGDLWSENPEIVAFRFTVHEQNIDSLEKAA